MGRTTLNSIFILVSTLCLSAAATGCGKFNVTGTFDKDTVQATTGTAKLTWDAPSKNVDNTALTDLAGYKVLYGTAPGTYTKTVDVGNVTSYTVTDLPKGATYYFTVKAYDLSGNESVASSEKSKAL